MRRFLLAIALTAAAPLAMAASGNWNTTFAATENGHRVGNPNAETHLMMFVSYSCPHCANFEKQADAALRAGYIHSGRVSVEVRHMIRNPLDLAAALATECGPQDRFFSRHRAMMLAHDTWMAKAQSATAAQQQRWSSGTLPSRMRAIAADLDFYELMEPRGLSRTALDRCLSDEARAAEIAATSQAQSARYSIPGTPSFVINGELLEGVHTWPALRSALDAAS